MKQGVSGELFELTDMVKLRLVCNRILIYLGNSSDFDPNDIFFHKPNQVS